MTKQEFKEIRLARLKEEQWAKEVENDTEV